MVPIVGTDLEEVERGDLLGPPLLPRSTLLEEDAWRAPMASITMMASSAVATFPYRGSPSLGGAGRAILLLFSGATAAGSGSQATLSSLIPKLAVA